MIEDLHIRGVGGIKDARITLNGKFIVITGESGAGKSSLVRSLEFIAGKRAQANLIHAGTDLSDVQMMIATGDMRDLPEEYRPQDGMLIARRTFDRNGRGKCSLQGNMTPLSTLARIMEKEIVIQSQFAQLGLLDSQKQLSLIDSNGGEDLKVAKRELETTFSRALKLERGIFSMKKERYEVETRFQNAEGALRMLRALEYTADSQQEWERELAELESKTKRIALLNRIAERYSGAAGGGVLEELESICNSLYSACAPHASKWEQGIERLLSSAQELKEALQSEIRGEQSTADLEEAKDRLEMKLGVVRKLRRELNLSTDLSLAEYAQEASAGLKWLKSSRSEVEAMESEAVGLRKKITELAMKLRALRKKAAANIADVVNRHLRDMAMELVRFEIVIESLDTVRAGGAESASFMLALPDQRPQPVGKTASGGELSRILIALQLTSGDEDLPGTLVFDEVEAGLGGRTAVLAGEKLRELSSRCRTVLITHEAAIAAMADQHFLVSRAGDETEIIEISGAEREREIARMLAGDDSSAEALEHARALLTK